MKKINTRKKLITVATSVVVASYTGKLLASAIAWDKAARFRQALN